MLLRKKKKQNSLPTTQQHVVRRIGLDEERYNRSFRHVSPFLSFTEQVEDYGETERERERGVKRGRGLQTISSVICYVFLVYIYGRARHEWDDLLSTFLEEENKDKPSLSSSLH